MSLSVKLGHVRGLECGLGAWSGTISEFGRCSGLWQFGSECGEPGCFRVQDSMTSFQHARPEGIRHDGKDLVRIPGTTNQVGLSRQHPQEELREVVLEKLRLALSGYKQPRRESLVADSQRGRPSSPEIACLSRSKCPKRFPEPSNSKSDAAHTLSAWGWDFGLGFRSKYCL